MKVNEVSQFLAAGAILSPSPLIDPHADQVRTHVLRADRGQEVIHSILYKRELSSVEDHTYLWWEDRERMDYCTW